MIELLQYVLQSPLHFVGTAILIWVTAASIAIVLRASRKG